jgi:hypothetical protein
MAILYPMLELSCGRVYKIPDEVTYLYKITPQNDNQVDAGLQAKVAREILKRPKYPCYKEFDERMKSLP